MVEPGPGCDYLAAGTWQRLEALPDPRSPQGRIYPLACLIAIASACSPRAGNDRFTAVGQWIKSASQADLARLRAPWDPLGGRYRASDDETIRVDLDRLDPQALTRALLGDRPDRGGPPSASVRGYRALRAAQQAKMLARIGCGPWPWTARPPGEPAAPTAPGVHLIGEADHGGHLLDRLEVGVKRNETSHFTELLKLWT